MKQSPRLFFVQYLPLVGVAVLALGLGGCTNSTFKSTHLEGTYIDRSPQGTLDQAAALYASGDYAGAYAIAEPIARDYLSDEQLEAAYTAGLCALALGDLPNADRWLNQALRSQDQTLGADAAASLGMVYARQGRYRRAADILLWAAARQEGEDKAHAFYSAGIAQQKLGQWSQARATLYNALRHTSDVQLQSQIREQLATTGWTLQVGAFDRTANARAQAESVAARAQELGLGLPRLVPSSSNRTLVQVGVFTSYQSAARYRDSLGAPGVIIKSIGQ